MTTASLVSEVLRVDRLESGDRQLVRDLIIDLGTDMRLDEDPHGVVYRSTETATTHVRVPAGFETDFSSIPAFARFLYRFDSVDLAGCCHDVAYRIGVPRAPADQIWRIVATSGKRRVGRVRGRLGWLGLRLGGFPAYRPTGDPMVRPG